MLYENEKKTMKAPSFSTDGPSDRHMLAPAVRVKVFPLWFQILLLIFLFAGHASCNVTSAAPSSFSRTTLSTVSLQVTSPTPTYATTTTTTATATTPRATAHPRATTTDQSGVYYFLDVTVYVTGQKKDEQQIIDRLRQVFQNELGSCVSQNNATTATRTTPQTTINETSNMTTVMLHTYNTTSVTATTLQSYNTSTAFTMPDRKNTTTGTITTQLGYNMSTDSTTLASNETSQNNNTTTGTTTDLQSFNKSINIITRSESNTTVGPTTSRASTTILQRNNTFTGTTTNTITATLPSNNSTTMTSTTSALQNSNPVTGTTTNTVTSTTALPSNSPTTITSTMSTLPSNNPNTGTTTSTITTSTLPNNPTTMTSTISTTLQRNPTTSATPTAPKTTLPRNRPTTPLQSRTTTTPPGTTAAPTQSSTSSTTSPTGGGETRQTSDSAENNRPTREFVITSRRRAAREIRNNETLTTESNDNITTGLVQGFEVSCAQNTSIRIVDCHVILKLRRWIPPCCILSSLCAASKTSSDIHVVGKRVDRVGPLQPNNTNCSNVPQENNSCIYVGQSGLSCEDSESAYEVPENNSTQCGGVKEKNNCTCSSYCSRNDAYYTFQLSTQSPTMNTSYISNLLNQLSSCSPSAGPPCPLSNISSLYMGFTMRCGHTTNSLSCIVVLHFSQRVSICAVSAALTTVFQSENIIFNGRMTRAAICGNSNSSENTLTTPFTLVNINLKPDDFCRVIQKTSNLLPCQNGKNVVVQLEEQCVHKPFTTQSPSVTTVQPNTTTITTSANVTSSPVNTIAEVFSSTTTATPVTTTVTTDATTAVTSINANTTITTTTTTTDTITSAVNATVTDIPNTKMTTVAVTATTGDKSVPVPSSESPSTTLEESSEAQANALLDMTRDVSNLNSSQVSQLVSQLEILLSGPTVSLALGNTSINIVSNLLGASPDVLEDSSTSIIRIVDTVGLKVVLGPQRQKSSEDAVTLLAPALALSVKTADGTNFQETFFAISDPNNVEVRGDSRPRRSVRKDSTPQGSIKLPSSLTENLTTEQQQQVSRVQFNYYQKSTVFQDRTLNQNRKLNSGILGASVANLSITGLQDDIIIHLRNTEPIPGNFVATCVFWDFTLNDGSGGWNPHGCYVRNTTDNETVCGCNHLTSFAILLNLSRQPLVSRVQATILTFITYIGCGISAIFLAITLLTYLSFGKLRKDIPSKILIHLCTALLLLNLVFLVDAWLALYPEAVGLCISTAWFLHYFLLVAFTWMGLEAVHMYLALVKVFNSYISRYMLKFSIAGWGIPMIVVIIVIAIDKDNYGLVSYGKFSDGTSDDFCWLKNDIAFYVAVVAYFCVIFLFNLVMFVVVLVQLCRIKKQNPHNVQHRTTLQDVRSVVGITILLGLTWGFAFFAWGPLNLPFMYLFAIFNSLQGFFIFVFHCAVKENVRRQWRTYLCCGKMRLAENSEWSRTATQKTMKKSSTTRVTSLSNSSQSHNSSSSSSFLVTDSLEQINGIGSPFEDRTITADEEPSMDVILNEINRQHQHQHIQ
ncbi:adhesion G-protein coupled receptor G2 isoform X3 [Sphaeramia orbicularis]|uniref:adhesion G-protein coupled receptor G2 isoform X2 n=1 Tax=Sphaeramia orbicularis TaxID=375764 RepID=UPI00117D7BA3|nr:adhesion G-protein coupled receptor G2-like isoform X2 [Sphaeramia orbicularis]XP_030009688.1 adhesion G-protein coupled receptor G2-like isoform X3 [Sphaeramia orbicularis]